MVNEKVNIGNFLLPRDAHQLVSMRGEIDWKNTSNVILELNQKLKDLLPTGLRKKVLKIATEMLDNLVKYNVNQPPDVFMVLHTKDRLYFLSQNLIKNPDLLITLEKILWVNELEIEDMKAEYSSQLKEGTLSELGGAGLGILEMARKSNQPIQFNVETRDKKTSFITLLVNITID